VQKSLFTNKFARHAECDVAVIGLNFLHAFKDQPASGCRLALRTNVFEMTLVVDGPQLGAGDSIPNHCRIAAVSV
jgi:hypothetical protein